MLFLSLWSQPPIVARSLKNKEQGPLQGRTLHYYTVVLMAGDLQIISIDQDRDHAECRADSKIIST